jgi:ABC-type arginine/histidine transport system permease subunit
VLRASLKKSTFRPDLLRRYVEFIYAGFWQFSGSRIVFNWYREFNAPEAHLRKIQVLILRLFLDSGLPEVLRGTLQAVPDGKAEAFHGEAAFLAVLHQYNHLEAEPEGDRQPINPIQPESPG